MISGVSWSSATAAIVRFTLRSASSTSERYLREHACSSLQIADVMRASGLSRTLLERLFRKHFGVSPYEHALRHRIAIAEQLLKTTPLTIAEIAGRVGFTTVEHFTTTYTRRQGCSPGATRRAKLPHQKAS